MRNVYLMLYLFTFNITHVDAILSKGLVIGLVQSGMLRHTTHYRTTEAAFPKYMAEKIHVEKRLFSMSNGMLIKMLSFLDQHNLARLFFHLILSLHISCSLS